MGFNRQLWWSLPVRCFSKINVYISLDIWLQITEYPSKNGLDNGGGVVFFTWQVKRWVVPVLFRSSPMSGLWVNFSSVFLVYASRLQYGCSTSLDDTLACETQSRKRFYLLDFLASERKFFLETPASIHLCLMTWADSSARESRKARIQNF